MPWQWDRVYAQQEDDKGTMMLHCQQEAEPLPVGVRRWKKAKPKEEVCLVTPFAGKRYCFNEYLKGIKRLPTDKMSAIFYDNSCDDAFQKTLIDTGKKMFAEFTLLVDPTPPKTIESCEDYKDVSWRCHQVYRTIQKYLNGDKYTFVVEDDVEIPKNTLERLMPPLEENDKLITIVGSCKSRRLEDRVNAVPIIWKFVIQHSIPPSEEFPYELVQNRRIMQEKPYGIELIGSSHMGCWLTKTKMIKKLGFKWHEDGVSANDCVWGYRANKLGYQVAINWAVKTKHHWQLDGKKGWY